ncbi:hypothetical protein Pth03_44600 [Planotetraspora thailandica]|uniref:SMI1/KNR4 family protein n=1 Tax=Planotetraspora thailandica TaxID=487172 RepID=A0A8J3V6Y3_9ACTN|nr:hypothetical protein [Planotetraspora thailandica]GII56071.1 hypothetical protein Pth03_44600 [Planotetraspora thailandica]
MPTKFDLPSVLAAGVQSRENAWSFIRGFADAWMKPLRNGDGYGEAELNAAQERLGFELPLALRQALALFGKRPDLSNTMHHLLPPDDLHYDSELLMFYSENSGAWDCGIRYSNLSLEDPPTVLRPWCSHDNCVRGIPWFDKLSTACIALVLTESLYSDHNAFTLYGELLPDEIPMVGQRFLPAALPSSPAQHTKCFPKLRWYVGEDVIVSLNTYDKPIPMRNEALPGWTRDGMQAELYVRARTHEALQSIRESLPAEWFNWRPVYGGG